MNIENKKIAKCQANEYYECLCNGRNIRATLSFQALA